MNPRSNLPFSSQFIRRVYIGLLIMLVLAVLGIGLHIMHYFILRYNTEKQTILNVATIPAALGPSTEEIVLPGNVQAWHETTIYARTNGYTINWLVDIGSHVKAGDLLAMIASPEVDAALRETEANLKTAEANNQLAQSTAKRWLFLLKTNSVSKQETDEKVSDAKAKAAIVTSTRATRDRLRDLVNFEKVIAPFDGVITSRTTDIGRLINAGSGATLPLFRIVQTDPLRVYIRVPQYYATRIKPGVSAYLYLPEQAGRRIPAKLLDNAQAMDATTRTLLIQLELSNPNDEILAGSYAEVHLLLPGDRTHVRLPVNALIFRAEGMQVATIDGDSTTILKPIIIGRDFGDEVEVVSGLTPGETVILNPPDAMVNGQKVHIVQRTASARMPTG